MARNARLGMILTTLALATFAVITTEMLPVGLLPGISTSLGVPESTAGLLVSVYAGVVLCLSIPLTSLVVRWPRKIVLVVVLSLFALSNLVFALTSVYAVAVAARLAAGAAHAVFFSLTFAIAISLVPAHRMGRTVAILGAGNTLALALGVPLGTLLGSILDWRVVFIGMSIVLGAFAVLVAVVVPAAPAPGQTQTTSVLRAATRGPLLRVSVVVIVLILGHFTVYTYISPLLTGAGVASNQVGLALLAYGCAGAIGLVFAGKLADKTPRTALIGAIAVCVVAMLGLSLVRDSAPIMFVLVVFWGVAFGAAPTLLQTLSVKATLDVPDAAPAALNTSFNIGIAGGAFIGSRELLVAGPALLAVTGAGLAFVALVLVASPRWLRL